MLVGAYEDLALAGSLVAIRPLHTDLALLEHPEGIEGRYFRYVFNEITTGDLSLLAFGLSEILSEEEAPDGSLTFDDAVDATARFRIVRSCVQLTFHGGETNNIVLILFPYDAEEN